MFTLKLVVSEIGGIFRVGHPGGLGWGASGQSLEAAVAKWKRQAIAELADALAKGRRFQHPETIFADALPSAFNSVMQTTIDIDPLMAATGLDESELRRRVAALAIHKIRETRS